MKSRILSLACVSALVVAGCDGDGGTADEEGAQDTTAEFAAAADAVAAKLASGIPDASDPAVAAFDAQLTRAMSALGTPELPLAGFDSYDALCGKTATIVQSYVGTGDAEQLTRNIEARFDQIFNPLLFSAHCSAEHMPFIEQETKGDVAGKAEALRQVREGIYGQVGGLVEMASDTTLEAERRARIVDLLATDAADFAIILSAGQRKELAAAAGAIAGLPAESAAKPGEFAQALTGAPCAELCQL